ncbi:zinc finger CCCH domain-containing protein 62-like isoform X2 [Rhododendron vialii]|uniref:zinc finger CCCH domain-containing protein 62-like isoform X2 n=1 Tax=Rhododendron vialii TaxID=182163 RepID=UPI00265FF734|nr:zinc finger CCCH domain-containing protein 62-like isoform X2 [Rhododendron vialii]
MTERRGNKRTYIQISSSSSGDDEEEEEDRSESQSESESEEYDGSDDDECVEIRASSTPCDDEESGSDDEDDESDDDKDENDESDEESRCNSVIRLLRERSGLQELNLKDCRAYLRKHGLRITGTKVECIQRIMEHWRIKDGNAEALFPRSSFTINCTGDVCKGDTVLFTQKVYKKFDKVTRSGTSIGKRTVAGRVVKESYGAAKQQHTFTVEVLWSKGMKKLPPLFPLLVKGRNLYKLKTFRQRWKNETERHKVLAEKHKRGAAARLVRAKMKTKKACSKNGVKRQKRYHPEGKSAGLEKGKHAKGCDKAPMEHAKSSTHRQKAPAVARANLENSFSSASKPSRNRPNPPHPNQYRDLTTRTCTFPPQNFHQSQMPYHHHQSSLQFPPTGSTSSRMGFPHFRPYVDSSVMPLSQHQGSNHGFYPYHVYSHPSWVFEPSNLNPSPELMNIYGLSKTYGQRR